MNSSSNDTGNIANLISSSPCFQSTVHDNSQNITPKNKEDNTLNSSLLEVDRLENMVTNQELLLSPLRLDFGPSKKICKQRPKRLPTPVSGNATKTKKQKLPPRSVKQQNPNTIPHTHTSETMVSPIETNNFHYPKPVTDTISRNQNSVHVAVGGNVHRSQYSPLPDANGPHVLKVTATSNNEGDIGVDYFLEEHMTFGVIYSDYAERIGKASDDILLCLWRTKLFVATTTTLAAAQAVNGDVVVVFPKVCIQQVLYVRSLFNYHAAYSFEYIWIIQNGVDG